MRLETENAASISEEQAAASQEELSVMEDQNSNIQKVFELMSDIQKAFEEVQINLNH
ncbi:MAG: hypothetical protein N2376_05780 [Clostridia bacterium]|nr:hypothetical protein [Clostridia bacterium]